MDGPEQLFEQILAGSEAFIEQMVEEHWQENLYLDFKQADKNKAPMTDGDRKTLAEVLSGYANSDGGVIVWGVASHRGPEEDAADHAQEPKPIRNLSRWLSDLNSATAQIVSPTVPGVRHEIIPQAANPEQGYAVSYIPKSDSLHMAIARVRDQYSYFIRSGDSFKKMESFQIQDRYQRRPPPKLALEIQAKWEGYQTHTYYGSSEGVNVHGNTPPLARFHLTYRLLNRGRGISEYPSLVTCIEGVGRRQDRLAGPMYDADELSKKIEVAKDGWQWTFMRAKPGIIIYPFSSLTFHTDIIEVEKSLLEKPESVEVSVSYRIYCDGFSEEGMRTIDMSQIPRD